MAAVDNSAQRIKLSLANLNDYNNKLKPWVLSKIDEGKGVLFAARSNFPIPGKSDVIYVDNDKLYRWDMSTSDYMLINAASGGEPQTLEWVTI